MSGGIWGFRVESKLNPHHPASCRSTGLDRSLSLRPEDISNISIEDTLFGGAPPVEVIWQQGWGGTKRKPFLTDFTMPDIPPRPVVWKGEEV